MNDSIFIQHRFTIEKDGKTYTDAIVLPLGDYEKLSSEEIEVIKEQRFNNWDEQVKNPVTPSNVHVLADIESKLVELENQKAALILENPELLNKSEPIKGVEVVKENIVDEVLEDEKVIENE